MEYIGKLKKEVFSPCQCAWEGGQGGHSGRSRVWRKAEGSLGEQNNCATVNFVNCSLEIKSWVKGQR
jgi:hypothetical protein